jgi:tyrosyl-tRNA synthetase
MTREEIDANAETYKEQVFKILDPETTVIDFNARWLGQLSSFEIMKLMAKYTVARILERDDFANRLAQGHPISTHELLYPLMQAYDSVALEADVEMGGTDQKFNLLVGRDIQREFGQSPQIVHTMPLLEGLGGVEKMSKSLDNYVGITEPPQDIFGKIMSISDPLMFRYYELLTDVPQADIEAMREQAATGTAHPRALKVKLARSIVADFWGEASAKGAAEEFDRIFTQREVPTDMQEVEIALDRISLLDLLTENNLLPSRGEAKRMIRQGGIYLDGQRAEDITLELELDKQPEIVIKIGKKRFYRITRKQG